MKSVFPFSPQYGSTKALKMLEEARLKAPTPTEKAWVDKAICETLAAGRKWGELMIAAKRLAASKTYPEEGFRFFIKAAASSEKWRDLELESQSRLKANPDHLAAVKMLVLAKLKLGDKAGAKLALTRLSSPEEKGVVEAKTATFTVIKFLMAEDRNYAAWAEMALGIANTETLSMTKKRTDGEQEGLLTKAMLEAILKHPDEAQADLSKSIGTDSRLSPLVWAAHGEICAQWGFNDCAQSSFELAKKQASKEKFNDTVRWLLPLVVR